MKKFYSVFVVILCALTGFAQDQNGKAMDLVIKNSAAIGLSPDDVQNSIVHYSYESTGTGITLVYLQQSYKGLPVLNQLKVLGFRGGVLVSNAGSRIKAIQSKVNVQSTTPTLSAANAVRAAMTAKKVIQADVLVPVSVNGSKINFGKPSMVNENITAELMWIPLNDGKELKLGWQVYLVPKASSDYWLIRVDATSGSLLDETNLTVYCNWDHKKPGQDLGYLNYKGQHRHTPEEHDALFDFSAVEAALSPAIVNSASYRVIPFPAESPKHPGGGHALKTNPWDAAPGNATTLKWHSNGTSDFNVSRGNNVWATEDRGDVDNCGIL